MLFGLSGEFVAEIIDSVLRVASQIWARFECLRSNWDWRILTYGMESRDSHTAVLGGKDAALLDAFYGEDGCCLGAWLSEWLQALPRETLEGDLGFVSYVET